MNQACGSPEPDCAVPVLPALSNVSPRRRKLAVPRGLLITIDIASWMAARLSGRTGRVPLTSGLNSWIGAPFTGWIFSINCGR